MVLPPICSPDDAQRIEEAYYAHSRSVPNVLKHGGQRHRRVTNAGACVVSSMTAFRAERKRRAAESSPTRDPSPAVAHQALRRVTKVALASFVAQVRKVWRRTIMRQAETLVLLRVRPTEADFLGPPAVAQTR